MKQAQLSWKVVSRVLVAHSTDGTVVDATFQKFLETQKTGDFRAYLATTTGSSELTSVQRKASSEALSARNVVAYVVTDSRLVRGIVTAASWLGLNAKAFAWEDIDKAIDEIGKSIELTDTDKRQVRMAVDELKAQNDAKVK